MFTLDKKLGDLPNHFWPSSLYFTNYKNKKKKTAEHSSEAKCHVSWHIITEKKKCRNMQGNSHACIYLERLQILFVILFLMHQVKKFPRRVEYWGSCLLRGLLKEKQNKPADLKRGDKITIFPKHETCETDQKWIQPQAVLTNTVTPQLYVFSDQCVTLQEALERNPVHQKTRRQPKSSRN